MDHEELISNWNRMDKAVVDVGLTAAAMSAMSEEIDRLRQRAEAAEVIAREQAERNLHNIGLCTQALQQRDEWRKRAEVAETRVKELEADLRSVPVMELMRAYPAVRWYAFNDEIRIRKWVEGIETLYAQWLSEQPQPAAETLRV